MSTGVTISLDDYMTDKPEHMQRSPTAWKLTGTEQIEIGQATGCSTILISRTPESMRALAALATECADNMETHEYIEGEGEPVPNRPEDNAVDTQKVVPSVFHDNAASVANVEVDNGEEG